MIFVEEQKTHPITRVQVQEAFKRVRANDGSAGVDKMTIAQVDANKRKYLYPLWNRLSSGSYYPTAVRQKLISKGGGKMRPLGIPTITDRVAQQVIATELETIVDKQFSPNSFGYRPNKSAHDAVEQCRINCMKYSWVVDLDIKGFFDNIDHTLLMKALCHYTDRKHILMYCERWLQAPVQLPDGTIKHPVGKGTPQGGVISPLLANLYLHFTLDVWLSKHYPEVNFVRYADDVVVHCTSKAEAERGLEAIKQRLAEVKQKIKEEKTPLQAQLLAFSQWLALAFFVVSIILPLFGFFVYLTKYGFKRSKIFVGYCSPSARAFF